MAIERKTTWLGCIAEKHTKKQLSEIVEVTAWSIYGAADAVQAALNFKVDGYNNYVDLVELED